MIFSREKPVLIAGGGIGGLSLALALSKHGIPVKLFEQAETFSEVGAGIQLGPNATRILSQWGLEEEIAGYATEPEYLVIKNGKNNKKLNQIPFVPLAQDLFHAPYYTIHRADLQNTLLKTVLSTSLVQLHTSFKVDQISQQANDHIEIFSSQGQAHKGSLLIGADGLWSTIRQHIHPHITPEYSGRTAWRALIPMPEQAPELKTQVTLYMGPNSHLVHYPVKSGAYLNIVAIITDKNAPDRQWGYEGDISQLLRAFCRWSLKIQRFLSSIMDWKKWALYSYPSPQSWSLGRATLLGDAAHPTLPFMAQGAVMAIEDAQALSTLIANNEGTIENALHTYQSLRYPRTAKVQQTSKKQGLIYHMRGPFAFARNQAISLKSPKSMLNDYSWLYGYKG